MLMKLLTLILIMPSSSGAPYPGDMININPKVYEIFAHMNQGHIVFLVNGTKTRSQNSGLILNCKQLLV